MMYSFLVRKAASGVLTHPYPYSTGLPEDDTYGSSDESDLEDEDDEDSNGMYAVFIKLIRLCFAAHCHLTMTLAEDWYKNDYPDEEDDRSSWGDEDGRSDEFHDDSESEGAVHAGLAGGRGRWTLEEADN
jgi:hypothetical protein